MSESKVKSAMIAAHDALDSGVYIVETWVDGSLGQHGVFTTSEKAIAWMETLPGDVKCICAPFVLDHPEFGNTPKEEMQ